MGIIAWHPLSRSLPRIRYLILMIIALVSVPVSTKLHEVGHGLAAIAIGAEHFKISLIDFGFNGGYCECYGDAVALNRSFIISGCLWFEPLFFVLLTVFASRAFAVSLTSSLLQCLGEIMQIQLLSVLGGFLILMSFCIFGALMVVGDLNEEKR